MNIKEIWDLIPEKDQEELLPILKARAGIVEDKQQDPFYINKWFSPYYGKPVFAKFDAEELGEPDPGFTPTEIPKPTNNLKTCNIPNITEEYLTPKKRWKYPKLIELFERHNKPYRFSREDVSRLNPVTIKSFDEPKLQKAKTAVKQLFTDPPEVLSDAQSIAVSLLHTDELVNEYIGEALDIVRVHKPQELTFDTPNKKVLNILLTQTVGCPEHRVLDTYIKTKILIDPSILERN